MTTAKLFIAVTKVWLCRWPHLWSDHGQSFVTEMQVVSEVGASTGLWSASWCLFGPLMWDSAYG